MSRNNYDNWERLVTAVIRRDHLRQLCYTKSISSISSSSFRSDSSEFEDPKSDTLIPKYQGFLPFKTVARLRPEKKSKSPGRLVFSKGCPFSFDLTELLMASSDSIGDKLTTYNRMFVVILIKKELVITVKKTSLKNLSLEKIQDRMKLFEGIQHENVAPPRGYCFSDHEMLEFFDYFPQGSVQSMLHGKGVESRLRLDWESRIRVALGVAKGLAHIHKQSNGTLSHGNIKSSNVFLNSKKYGCLGDLYPADELHSGYDPPEDSNKLSQEFDVYSFGALLFELLSGRSPMQASFKDG